MATCLIGLGSNLGDRARLLDEACRRLREHPDIVWHAVSQYHDTSPVGGPAGQGAFLNAAARVETALSPQQLLGVLQEVEHALGRQRGERWEARVIDLDLLLYGELECETPTLCVPHRRMAFRRFVLAPANEVASDMVHPPTGWTVGELLRHLDTAADYVAVTGAIGSGKTGLVAEVARLRNVRWIRDPVDEEAFDADPGGLAWTTQLEFLSRRQGRLAQATWSAEGQWSISDFWFDQSLAVAAIWLDETDFERFARRWEEANRQVVQPKLVVWLEVSVDILMERIKTRVPLHELELARARVERLVVAVGRQAERRGRGPVLRLRDCEFAEAVAEMSAALDAMQ